MKPRLFSHPSRAGIMTAAALAATQAGAGDDASAGGQEHDTAFLDGGQDTFVWNPGDASDSVDGGGGQDTMQFNGSNGAETKSLSAAGGNAVLVRDVATVDGTEKTDRIAVTTQAGAVDVTGLKTTTHITGAHLNDLLQVDALGGNDAVSVAPDVATVMGVTTDLGTGQR